jgi:hypothetical protein
MKRFIGVLGIAALAVVAVSAVTGSALAAPPSGPTATPASTQTWAGTYTAQFARSASGIINETNRVNSAGAQNEWSSSNVWLQFRPNPGTPANPNCDPTGLVTPQFTYVNDPQVNPTIAGTPTSGYFLPGVTYNVCVYLVNPVIASGTVDSANQAGASVSLPNAGHYRIEVSGTWQNSTWGPVDAEYTTVDNWVTPVDGFNQPGYDLGPNFGDLQVGGQFVDWGAYNGGHAYSYTAALPGGSLNLAVFDGQNGTPEPSWYGDNSGSLNYTITYLGL